MHWLPILGVFVTGSLGVLAACGGDLARGAAPSEPPDASRPEDLEAARAYDARVPRSPGAGSPCPTEPPAAATSCSSKGLACEYGDRDETECNVLATCEDAAEGGQRWSVEQPRAECAAPRIPTSVCQASWFPQPASDSPCTTEGAYGTCIYHRDQWLTRCACFNDEDGAPRRECRHASAPTDCPNLRPRLGAPCDVDRQICDYGKCFFAVQGVAGHRLRCSAGVWAEHQQSCP